MNTAIQTLHLLAALVVLAEALNKMERAQPFAPGLRAHDRLVDGLKALAWMLLALGAAGALASPVVSYLHIPVDANHHLLGNLPPSMAETLVMTGFATLIVRTRIKEG